MCYQLSLLIQMIFSFLSTQQSRQNLKHLVIVCASVPKALGCTQRLEGCSHAFSRHFPLQVQILLLYDFRDG